MIFTIDQPLPYLKELEHKGDMYLTLINATRIPPHLGITFQGKVFHQTIEGLKITPLRTLEIISVQKKIPIIFLQIKAEPLTIAEITKHFEETDISSENTCLSPLARILCNNSNPDTVHHLIHLLVLQNKTGEILSFMHNKKQYILPHYTKEEVKAHIDTLKSNKGKTPIHGNSKQIIF